MVIFLMLGLALLCAFRALSNWRQGIFLMIVLAAIQDPLRKLVPGTPGYLVLFTAPVFIAAVFASSVKTRAWWGEFRKHNPSIANGLLLLMLLALPAAVQSATYGSGTWMLTVLGAFSYSVIFFAVIAGFHYARNGEDVRKLLAAYCICHGVMLSGAFLEYAHVFQGSRLLGSKVLGYEWIRWGQGYVVDMLCGFYRSADVMGWHAASVCMLSIVLGVSGGRRRFAWYLLAVFAAAALLLCGRRKMVYMIPVFLLAFGYVFWQAGRAAKVIALAAFLSLPMVGVAVVGDMIGEGSANIRYYRGEGLQKNAWESVSGQGFRTLRQTYLQSGVFGAGLGFATPGSHHLRVERPHFWQESTSSRVLVELGVPGALGFLFVMLRIAMKLWKTCIAQLRARTPISLTIAGLVAFFMANVGSLTVSGQILADPFIAGFLGLLVGVALSPPRLAKPAHAILRVPEANAAVPVRVVRAKPTPSPHLPVATAESVIMDDLRLLPWER